MLSSTFRRRLGGVVLFGLMLTGCDNAEELTGPLVAAADTKPPTPGPTQPPPFRLTSIAAGTRGTCGLDANGGAWCWGYPLGNGTFASSLVPVRVGTALTFEHITSDGGAVCAIAARARPVAYCWGNNWEGQFGTGVVSTTNAPVSAFAKMQLADLHASGYHVCAVAVSGDAFCSGHNSPGGIFFAGGQLGDGTTADSWVPVLVHGNHSWTQITAGRETSCGLTAAGAAYCWGANVFFSLGAGSVPNSTTPVPVATPHKFSSITAGDRHACALRPSGEAYCWGRNFFGELGIGADAGDGVEWSEVPVPVVGGLHFEQIDAASGGPGGQFVCGVATDGTAYCWGLNSHGQLGNGTTGDSNVPTQVVAPFKFTQVSAGAAHACGIRADNSAVYCWGQNESGQLGSGTKHNATVPVPVKNPGLSRTGPRLSKPRG